MRLKPLTILLTTAVVVVALDQASKAVVRAVLPQHQPFWLVPPVLALNHVQNLGAAFSLLQGQRWFFVLFTSVVLAVVAWVWWRYRPVRPWVVIALGLAVGGAVGNLIDRASVGTVTDFIDFQVFPVFNVADSCIVIGVGILVVWLLFGQTSREPDRSDSPGSGTASVPASRGASSDRPAP